VNLVLFLSGVPLGTNLAPLSFLLSINHIPHDIECTIRLYADYIQLYTDCQSLKKTYTHCRAGLRLGRWPLILHLTITNNCNKQQITSYSYQICGQLIWRVSEAKYLGDIWWASKLEATYCQHLYTKANAASSFLKRNITHCPTNIKSNWHKSFVRPILEYASSIWAPNLLTDIQKIEKIQHSTTCYVSSNYSWHSSVTSMLSSLEPISFL